MKVLKLALALVLLLALLVGGLLLLSPRARDWARHGLRLARSQPIATVAGDAEDGASVLVTGVVRRQLSPPFTKRALFELEDETGSVFVTCEPPAPRTGRIVAVSGEVERSLGPLQALVQGGLIIESTDITGR